MLNRLCRPRWLVARFGWELLIAIADRAGGEWPARARNAALALSAPGESDNETLGVELLRDIRSIFETRNANRIGSIEMVEELVKLDSRPWAEYRRGRPLTATALARALRQFKIYKRENADGSFYQLSDFQDALDRYTAPYPPVESANVPQPLGRVGRNGVPEALLNGTLKSAEAPTESKAGGTMAPKKGGTGGREEF